MKVINRKTMTLLLALAFALAARVGAVPAAAKGNPSSFSIRGSKTRSLAESEVCGNLQVQCKAEDCGTWVRQMECVGLYSLDFIYVGGKCSMSHNTQGEKFECRDTNGGPPTEAYDMAPFIEVTNLKEDVIYHSAFVPTGDTFQISTSSAEDFPETLVHHIWDKNPNSGRNANLLQTIVIDTSCKDKDLFLMDRFGAIVPVAAQEAHGDAVAFSSTRPLLLTIPNLGDGNRVTLKSVKIVSSVPREQTEVFNFPELVGTKSDPGADLTIEVAVPATATTEETSISITVATVDSLGGECAFSENFNLPVLQVQPLEDP